MRETFPVETDGDVYHLGIHKIYENHGMYLIDRSYSPGITHYTVFSNDTDAMSDFNEHLINSEKCKVYDPVTDSVLNTVCWDYL